MKDPYIGKLYERRYRWDDNEQHKTMVIVTRVLDKMEQNNPPDSIYELYCIDTEEYFYMYESTIETRTIRNELVEL